VRGPGGKGEGDQDGNELLVEEGRLGFGDMGSDMVSKVLVEWMRVLTLVRYSRLRSVGRHVKN
jgi:hypothetical protein